MRLFLGVDPGASGAGALIDESGAVIQIQRFSETEKDISEFFQSIEPAFSILEQVHSMPKQGVASSFKFGMSYGFLRGMLIAHGIRFETVTPVSWQGKLRCRSKGDKNITKARAQELFPGAKVIHATADALLLAEFARRKELGIE